MAVLTQYIKLSSVAGRAVRPTAWDAYGENGHIAEALTQVLSKQYRCRCSSTDLLWKSLSSIMKMFKNFRSHDNRRASVRGGSWWPRPAAAASTAARSPAGRQPGQRATGATPPGPVVGCGHASLSTMFRICPVASAAARSSCDSPQQAQLRARAAASTTSAPPRTAARNRAAGCVAG